MFESRTDHMIMYQLAQKFGFAKEFVGKIKLVKGKGGMDEPDIEDTLREINRGVWTIGYTGQSPERLQAHMRNMHVFDVKTLRAKGGKDAKTGYVLDGDYFGLPWPCYGTAALKHPGSPNLYQTRRSNMMDGGGNFRANFGVETDGVSLLAEDGSHSKGADITTGYPEFDHVLLKKLGWWDELTEDEKKAAEGKNWKTDLSGGMQRVVMKKHGCHPFGNAKARADGVELPRCRCRCTASRSTARGRTWSTNIRPTTTRRTAGACRCCSRPCSRPTRTPCKQYPLIMTSGRLVEYEGGGDETRSNPWLAELQQEMFVEINPKDANDRGVRNDEYVWVESPTKARLKVKTLVTERVASGHRVPAVPFRRLVDGQGHAGRLSGRRGADRARRGGQYRDHLWLRHRDHDAGNQDHAVPGGQGIGQREPEELNHGENEISV